MSIDPKSVSSQRWVAPLICVALVAVTSAVYWPIRQHDFINYDDQEYVTQNLEVLQGLTWQGVVWAFTTIHSANWHPLTWLSHMLDCTLFGLNPAGHHLTNLVFHSANSVLLFMMLKRATGALWRSSLVAALFALHPLHVESVAWIAERKDVLSAFFGLLCLWAYVCHAQGSPLISRKVPSGVFYVLAMVFFALGLLCKPMLVSFPFLMLLLDFWPLRRLERQSLGSRATQVRGLLLEKVPFLILACGSSLITWHAQHAAMSYYRKLPFELRLENAMISCARYLGKMVWPRDLAILYPYPGHWPASYFAAAALLLAAISAATLWSLHRYRYFAVGWLWFLVMLVPVLGLVQVGVQAMADRYTYMPLIGLFVIVAWGLADGARGLGVSSTFAGLSCALLLAACAVATRAQLSFWSGTEAIFTHAIAVTRDNWVAHYNLALLGLSHYQQEQRAGLEQQALQSSAGEKTFAPSAEHRDYLQEVVAHCQAALKANPGFPDPYVTLAKALTERGELEQARGHLQTALHLDSKNPDAHQNLAEIAYRQGRVKEAVVEYEAALVLRPDWEAVLNNLAWLLATYPEAGIRDGPQALQLAQNACRLTGYTNLWFLHTLAAAFAETGDFTNAITSAQAACERAKISGDRDLEGVAASRLALYRAHQPLRVSP